MGREMSADNRSCEPRRHPGLEASVAEAQALLANYPPPPSRSETDVPALELTWPTPLGWMTLAEYNRRKGISAVLAARRSAQTRQKD